MALSNIITYQELLNSVVNKILSTCQNIDSYASGVPAELKYGYTYKDTAGEASNVTLTLDDTLTKTVPLETVKEQLNEFLSSRGLQTAPTSVITLKGMLNFYNNISAFCSVRFKLVSSMKTSTTCVFYDSGEVTYPSVPTADLTPPTKEDITTNLTTLMNSLLKEDHIHHIDYTLNLVSSSCSSSSCSSSCSCSSSSFFVAYLKV